MDPNDSRPSRKTLTSAKPRPTSYSLGLLLAAALIVSGAALLLRSQIAGPSAVPIERNDVPPPSEVVSPPATDPSQMPSEESHRGPASSSANATPASGTTPAAARAVPVEAPGGAPTTTPVPPVKAQEAYCLWPDDTLSEIALNANVTEEAILAANPGWTGHAGSTIHLPLASTPPALWSSPAPAVVSVADLPFGASGYYLGRDNRQKRVALSFDIGYVDGNFELMKMLADRGLRATFFVLGGAVENHPDMIANILDNGHELGNHSYTHDNMLGMTVEGIANELSTTEQLVQAAHPGATTKPLFRPPFGAVDPEVVDAATSQGYQIVGWTVDSHDWKDEITAEALYERVTRLVCPGAIIAMHDVNPANRAALPAVLDFLQANGYQFVTVSDILFR